MGEPLLYRDRLLGVLVINNLGTARRFTPEDSRLLALLAGQAAIAIENARLYDETQRQAREARALAEVGRSLSASSRGTRCSSESSRRSPGSWASNSRGS
jgi:GAF domain-containing protein